MQFRPLWRFKPQPPRAGRSNAIQRRANPRWTEMRRCISDGPSARNPGLSRIRTTISCRPSIGAHIPAAVCALTYIPRVPGSNYHQMGKIAVHADLFDDGIDRRRSAVRTRARQWRAYALAERGPSNAQMMRPSKASNSTSTIQSALWPVGAPLCAIFTIAHTACRGAATRCLNTAQNFALCRLCQFGAVRHPRWGRSERV